MVTFYLSLGMFVATSVAIGVVPFTAGCALQPHTRGTWIAGACFLFYGSILLILEARLALSTIHAEMDFIWRQSKKVTPAKSWNNTNRTSFISDVMSDTVVSNCITKLEPSYLKLLAEGKLHERESKHWKRLLERCTVCPRDCLNNRLNDEIAACYSGRLPIVSSYTAHFGEEPPLVGTSGAGNIFFGNCNLRCVYCQNYQISQTHKEQLKNEVTHERLAEMMLELQSRGCHNINFVSPTHFAPQMARSILIAAEQGFARADCLQHECLRFGRSAATARRHR